MVWISCEIPSINPHEFDWAQVAWISLLSTSLNIFAWDLVTGLIGNWIGSKYASSYVLMTAFSSISSFPSSWRGFPLNSLSTSKGLNSKTLKVALMFYSQGKSSSYALSLICSKTWKWPSPQGNNMDFLYSRNHSLCMRNHAQSPGSNTSLRRPLLACLDIAQFSARCWTSPSHIST